MKAEAVPIGMKSEQWSQTDTEALVGVRMRRGSIAVRVGRIMPAMHIMMHGMVTRIGTRRSDARGNGKRDRRHCREEMSFHQIRIPLFLAENGETDLAISTEFELCSTHDGARRIVSSIFRVVFDCQMRSITDGIPQDLPNQRHRLSRDVIVINNKINADGFTFHLITLTSSQTRTRRAPQRSIALVGS